MPSKRKSSEQSWVANFFLDRQYFKIPLSAKVTEVQENGVTLNEIQANGFNYPTREEGGPFNIVATKRCKKFVCQAFGLGELKAYSIELRKHFLKIRSLNSGPESVDLESDLPGKRVYRTVTCGINNMHKPGSEVT